MTGERLRDPEQREAALPLFQRAIDAPLTADEVGQLGMVRRVEVAPEQRTALSGTSAREHLARRRIVMPRRRWWP